jgi:hypothetical protein
MAGADLAFVEFMYWRSYGQPLNFDAGYVPVSCSRAISAESRRDGAGGTTARQLSTHRAPE